MKNVNKKDTAYTLNLKRLVFPKSPVPWYTNQRVTSYYPYELSLLHELRVASYYLLHSYELRVTVCCMSYELLFAYELWVTAYCSSYELRFACELRVTVYCASYFFKDFFVTLSLTYL